MERVLVTGASGFLGAYVVPRLVEAGCAVTGTFCGNADRAERLSVNVEPLDLADLEALNRLLARVQPHRVVHAGAMADVRVCEADPQRAERVNAEATGTIAAWCSKHQARMVFISTDQVFDGERGMYRETDDAQPLHVYGSTKLMGERLVQAQCPHGVSVRLALMYGQSPSGTRSATEMVLRTLERSERPRLFTDEMRMPIHVEDAADAVVELTLSDWSGVIHLAGDEAISRYDLGVAVADAWGFGRESVEGLRQSDVELHPRRPRDLTLDSSLARRVLRMQPRNLRASVKRDAAQMTRKPETK